MDSRPSIGIVLAAGGYTAEIQTGDVIHGLDYTSDSSKVFHAGTTQKDGNTVTSGGRVLCVTALGHTVLEAQQQALAHIQKISFDGMQYRRDIGYRAIAREQAGQAK